MDKALKQRMVGAVVLIALGVIFIPMLLDGDSREDSRTVQLDIPEPPEEDYRSRLLPLDESGGETASSSEGRVRREAGEPSPAPESSPPPAPEESGSPEPGPGSEASAEPAEQTASPEPAPEAAEQTGVEPEEREPAERKPLGNWFVQVGSFSKKANAEELRERLRGAGYTAFVETSTVEGQTAHRVKVGPEMDRARAEKSRDEIQSEFDLKGIVVSEP